ncbi:MAG: hypothetical protein M1818_005287 [Claussenomyces sp. TS43310]|nr:MAG: hypothetical protein M1818_005287 [Claussenomyces sp. TS43310]
MRDHLSRKDDHLYVVKKSKPAKKEISSSTSLAFTSQLSSLLSTPSASSTTPTATTRGRQRPSYNKADIFTAHNRGANKRSLKDIEDDARSATGRQDLGGGGSSSVDASVLHRSKRKMEEKARLYAAMKRGDYVAGEYEPEQLIDFDRKWAENEARGTGNGPDTSSDSGGGGGDDDDDDDGDEMIEYVDEYGRARRGTKAEAERMERKKHNRLLGAEELDRMSARPAMPSQVIYGDTVQSAAFNPDEPITQKMEELAAKRDRSMTPPDMKHYEADKEIRSKGVGFFQFSKDEGMRKAEMEALERERKETERIRREKEERKEARRREVEMRRREIGEKRAKKQAESFLEGLTADLGRDRGDNT